MKCTHLYTHISVCLLTDLTLCFLIEVFDAIPFFIQAILKPNILFCHYFLFCHALVFPTTPFGKKLDRCL